MLTASQAALHNNKLRNAVAKLGTLNGFNKTNNPLEVLARRFYNLKKARAFLEQEFNDCVKEAVREGLIFDKDKAPRPPGTALMCYAGECISITLTVAEPVVRVNADKLVDFLKAKGVKQQVLVDAIKAATVQARPGHTFSPNLVIAEASLDEMRSDDNEQPSAA